MRLKPQFWFVVSLLLFAVAICTWQYGNRYATRHSAPANGKAARLQNPPLIKTAANSAGSKPKSYRISNTTQPLAKLLHNSHALILRNALIDTEVPVRLKIPDHLKAKGAPGSYLVQADRALDKDFYAELAKAGATYVSYVPNNAALVQASPQQATNLAANADVVAVLPYEPYYKLDGTLLPSAVEQEPQTNALSVTTFPGQRDAALLALTQLGAKLIGEDSTPFGPTLIVNVPASSLVAVAQLPLAQEIEAYTPRRLGNDLTRVQLGVSANTLIGTTNYLGLSGLNVTVNINDTGVDATHPDFSPTSRLTGDFPSSLTDSDGHGTHVAGIIAGNGSKSSTVSNQVPGSIIPGADFRGKATNAALFVQALDLIYGPFISDAFLQQNASSNLGPTNLISNNSWGYGDEDYDMHAASFDAATRDAQPNVTGEQPLLFVFAAGNNGNYSGSIVSPGTAKNVITVGAVCSPRMITNQVYEGTNTNQISPVFLGDTSDSNTIASFSSCGNVDAGVEGTYGRFKPDVVAPGVFTVSCRSSDYVDPQYSTIVDDTSLPNQLVQLKQTNIYPFAIPYPVGGYTPSALVVVISSNAASPNPFPTNMFLLAGLANPPTVIVSSNNFYSETTNVTSGTLLYFGVTSPTNQPGPVSYNIDFYLYETNYLGDYYIVLSNLNNALRPYYRYESGTSMSAGAVSGVLALMQEFLQTKTSNTNPSPALLKAMLINGSRSLNEQYDFDVTTEGANAQGWGIPNISNSIPPSLVSNITSMLLVDQSPSNALATGQYQTYTINCSDTNAAVAFPLRITLVWTDPPGNPAAGVALVNNLDLTVADATGTNIYVGNDFLSGDIFTEVSNPTNLPPGQSDNDVQNIYVNTNTAVFTSAGDSINNVQNVYITPANTPIVFPLTVTISGTRINVNAVTTQTNNILQDYALVVSSDDPALTSSLTITTNALSNAAPILVTVASNGVPLLHQRVGANEPNLYNYQLGLTNGNTSQWHFFVFTNNQFSTTNQATNVAFATFEPPNLSIPRVSGSADIDLYVSTNSGLTNLVPAVVEAADKSLGRTGTESIIYTNSTANLVYYIGVKSEDQQAADFGFYGVAQQAPFSSFGNNGSTVTASGTSLPVFIPNAISPTPALVFAFLFNPNPILQQIRRVTVTLGIEHPSPNDLTGTIQHDDITTYLNHNSTTAPANGFTNTYDDLQEDPGSGDIISDGPGSLTEFVNQTANGLWLLTEADNFPDELTGYVTVYTVSVDLQQSPLSGFLTTIPGQSWFDDYLYVPNDATNMIIYATFENSGSNTGNGPIGIYLTNELGPITASDFGSNGIIAPGGSLTLGSLPNPPPGWPAGTPVLAGGYWYFGIYNSNTLPVTIFVQVQIQESLTPNLVQTYTNSGGPIPLTTDGHTQSQICVSNNQQVVSLQVGVCLQDTNTDDLVLHLTSPEGTSVLLFEDRGGLTANGLGLPVLVTNGTGDNRSITTNYIYTVFTENTNLATVPIKFAPPPFAVDNVTPEAVLWSNSFETVTNGVYTNGAILEGWLVTNNLVNITTTNGPGFLTNDEVGIVTDVNGEQIGTTNLGSNYLALTSGHIIQTFGVTNNFTVTNGLPYQIVFYAKPMGVIDWWPADDNTDDIIGTNNGTIPFNDVTYNIGEVGQAFSFAGLNLNSDAGNEVDINTNLGNFGTNDFSVDFWIKQPPGATDNYGIMEKRVTCYPSTNFWDIRCGHVWNSPPSEVGGLSFEFNGQGPGVNYAILIANKPINDGQFHHAAFVRGGTNMSLYIDGVLNTNMPAVIVTLNNSAMLRLGQSTCVGTDGTQPFPGELDEIDLVNRALSPAEVYAIYHAGTLGKYNTNSLLPNFTLTIDSVSTNTIAFTNASGGWQLFTNSFIATNNQITVEFSGNPMGVLFDDIQLIQLPATNNDNYYLAEEPLTPFVGENPLGCWTLDVWDTRADSPLPTNGELLSWSLQLTTSSTNAMLVVLTNDMPTTNTVTNGDIAYFAIDVPSYVHYATNILTSISGNGPLTLFFNQDALPTGGLPGDYTLTNGVFLDTSTNVLATTGTLPPPLEPGQRYFLGVLNTGTTPAKFTLQVNFDIPTNIIIPLTNAILFTNIVGTNTIGTNGPEYYSFVVPTNAVQVTFQILNVTNGEVDLYARNGLPLPGPDSFDYASDNSGTNDQFIVVTTNSAPVSLSAQATNAVIPLSPSTWYLAAYNYPDTNNIRYTIVATVVTNQLHIIPLTNAIPYTNNLAPPGYPTDLLYSFTVTNYPGSIQFTVTNVSGVGNVQLLASLDVFPTPNQSYAGSFNAGTAPQVIQIVPTAALPSLNGTWYLTVPNTSNTNVTYSIEAITNYISPPANVPITWSGAVDDLWDVLATSNWVVTATPTTPYPFQNGAIVTFDDTAVGPTTVYLTTTLSPAAVTNNNSALAYEFIGPGSITSPLLIKKGTGTLIIDNTTANNFGAVALNAGTLQIGNNDANGSLSPSAILGAGPFTNNANLTFDRTDSPTIATVIAGTGNLYQSGPGTLSLSGVNTYSGATFITMGTLVVDDTNALGSWTGGAVTVSSGATLDLSGLSTANGPSSPLFGAKLFNIAGSGAGGNGAIVNNGPNPQQGGLENITLTTNATVGGSTEWDMRNGTPTLTLNNFTLTKVGLNQMSLVSPHISAGNIIINQGILSIEATPVFAPTFGTILVNSNTLVGQNLDTLGSFTGTIVLNGGGTTNLSGGGITYLDAPIELQANSSLGNGAGIEIFNGIISGSAGLVNLGLGSNLLSATNTYSGPTEVAQGTLGLTNTGSIANSVTITVDSNATFDASQRIDQTLTLASNQTLFANGTNLGNVVANPGSTVYGNGVISANLTMNPGTLLSPGSNGVAIGALTVANVVTLGGSNYMKIDENVSPSNDVLNATSVIYGGTLAVADLNTNGATTFEAGDSFVLYNTPTSSGAFANIVLPALPPQLAWSNSFAISGPGILTVVTNPGYVPPLPIVGLTWSGAFNGNWDILTTSNWVVTTNPSQPYPYQNGSVVTFDDSAIGTRSVDLTTALSPASVIISNFFFPYIFTGTGGITGAPLIVYGTLIVDNTANRFSSVMLNSGGTLQIGNGDAEGSLGTAAGILGSGVFTDNGTLVLDRSDTVVITNVIAGSGALTQAGADFVKLDGINTFAGPTSVNAGTLGLGPGGSLGATPVTVAGGANFANFASNAVTVGGPMTFDSGASVFFSVPSSNSVGPINVTSNLTLNDTGVILSQTSVIPLQPGTYRLMNCAGTLTGTAGAVSFYTGSTAAPYAATITTTDGPGGYVNLVISGVPVFSNLTTNPTIVYGTPSITLSGTVSAPLGTNTVYPANGDTVSVTINGNTVNGTINGANGAFSINYNDPSLQSDGVFGSPYTITYTYAGNTNLLLAAATDTSTLLTVTPLPVILSGTKLYDGTANAPASILTVVNAINGDVVTVASGNGTLAGTNVGVQPIVSFGNLALGGPAAINYTLTGASGSVTIIAAPPFIITSESLDNTGKYFIITWQSVPGTVYQVIAHTNVAAPLSTWTNVGSPVTAVATNTSATNPIDHIWNFFEVKNAGASGAVAMNPFPITSAYVDSTGSNIVITWQSTVNAVYRVISSSSVTAPVHSWPTVGAPVTATNTSTTTTNPITHPVEFFKVVSP